MQPATTGGGGGADLNHQSHHQHPHQSPRQQPSPQPYHQQQQWPPHQAYHPQQWMAMGVQPYPPAAAMAMQQQQMMMMMMYPHHYMPYVNYARHYHQQPPYHLQQQQRETREVSQQKPSAVKSGSMKDEDVKTIWIGDLQPWMDESYLQSCFASAGELISVKVIRNKQTGQSDGYGFVEFSSRAEAEKVLESYPGTTMPNIEQSFRLNWATFSPVERRSDPGSDLSVFVGDLAPDVTDTILQETFASKYQSIKGVKVVVDPNTGLSKGYGFVRFGDESEKLRAVTEMNGTLCLSRPMRVGVATPKRSPGYQHRSSPASVASGENGYHSTPPHGFQSDNDTNKTIFVGGVDAETTEEELRQPFSQFGEIISLKIPVGKGCAFVQFAERNNAEDAIQGLNGTVIGKQTLRLAWGRTPANKQWRNNHHHWNGGFSWGHSYRGGHGHSTPQHQDPSIHSAAAAATANGGES
uniref:RRM domain-containing protein n=1 Tax=Kalanchoe fedtschenkoi TaxID=63787 RepID=A0A7N0T496_KALFE